MSGRPARHSLSNFILVDRDSARLIIFSTLHGPAHNFYFVPAQPGPARLYMGRPANVVGWAVGLTDRPTGRPVCCTVLKGVCGRFGLYDLVFVYFSIWIPRASCTRAIRHAYPLDPHTAGRVRWHLSRLVDYHLLRLLLLRRTQQQRQQAPAATRTPASMHSLLPAAATKLQTIADCLLICTFHGPRLELAREITGSLHR